MALSKIDAANFLTGTLPAANINNTSIGNITALPDGVGGSLVKISSATASGDASVTFDNGSGGVVIDSTYKVYKVICNNLAPATDNVEFRYRFRSSGSDIASGYEFNVIAGFVNTTVAGVGSGSNTNPKMTYNNHGNATGEKSMFELTFNIDAYPSAFGRLTMVNNSDDLSNTTFSMRNTGATQPDGITFFYESGNISTGEFILYGVTD